jgi:60 kDa SS-A/Ro ribonucleoprotein
MANKNLFASLAGRLSPRADTINEAGGEAYAFSPAHALAQYAVTGCLSHTFYASDEAQLGVVLELASKVEPRFLAQVAIYAREHGHMKDVPALLLAVLSVRDPKLFALAFDRVVDNAKMLRTFVQIMRSGAVGRKSLGTRPKKQIRAWLEARSEKALFFGSIGASPSLADVVKMVHPKPSSDARRALYAYLIGKPYDAAALPYAVRRFEQYKNDRSAEVPDVPFQMLTALELDRDAWIAIAQAASWQTTRMNLNTFARHGVLTCEKTADKIAERLRDPRAVREARVFPYQLLVAYRACGADVPPRVKDALSDAMEHATHNVPEIDGRVFVCPDVSGSMSSPVTGRRKGATSAVRCVDVAALFAAAIVRKNRHARVLPFDDKVHALDLDPRDSVMTNATKLAAVGGGGTSVSAPLTQITREGAKADLVVIVSDNQSWIDASRSGSTATMNAWQALAAKNRNARLVCIDIQPYGHTQAADRDDILNVGGFSDVVFDVVSSFAKGGDARWMDVVQRVPL